MWRGQPRPRRIGDHDEQVTRALDALDSRQLNVRGCGRTRDEPDGPTRLGLERGRARDRSGTGGDARSGLDEVDLGRRAQESARAGQRPRSCARSMPDRKPVPVRPVALPLMHRRCWRRTGRRERESRGASTGWTCETRGRRVVIAGAVGADALRTMRQQAGRPRFCSVAPDLAGAGASATVGVATLVGNRFRAFLSARVVRVRPLAPPMSTSGTRIPAVRYAV
jgi:hypothetical protein